MAAISGTASRGKECVSGSKGRIFFGEFCSVEHSEIGQGYMR